MNQESRVFVRVQFLLYFVCTVFFLISYLIYILSCIGTLLYLEGILLFAFQCQFTLPFL